MPKAILILLLAIPPLTAVAEPPKLAGKTELSLFGSFDFSGPSGDNIDLRVGYGRFVRDDWLIGGEYQWRLIEDIAPGEKDYRSQQASVVVQKLFVGDDALLPFIGVEVGLRNTRANSDTPENAIDDAGLVVGARAGARYFLSATVALHASINWLIASDELFLVDFEPDDSYIYPSLGIHAVF